MDFKRASIAYCPVCRGELLSEQRLLRDHWSREEFKLAQCNGCKFLFLQDPPLADELSHFYLNEQGQGMVRKTSSLLQPIRRRAYLRDLKLVRQVISPGDYVVDLGSGDGSLSSELCALNCEVLACDQYAEQHWNLTNVPYLQLSLNGSEFDASNLIRDGRAPRLVIMRHVFEHLDAPQLLLEKLAAIEVDYLLIIVPNVATYFNRRFGGNWFYWDPPRHLSFFTPETLRLIARNNGFQEIASTCYGIDEVVVSLYRYCLLRGEIRANAHSISPLTRLFDPKGLLSTVSSILSLFGSTVTCSLFKRS